ncbi:metallophosphoesterase [Candidatus Dojkabacteria bacterium]|nr:metallophosphoesterase [Candidatus Dojkabacteria bacterium]
MKILFIGDISGRPGRHAVRDLLPQIKNKYAIDFVIANAENSAGGRGTTDKVLSELQSYGIDYFTSGEHIWDQKEMWDSLRDQNIPIVRPLNYEGNEHLPGDGLRIIDLGKQKIILINLLGQVFIKNPPRSPFWIFDELWEDLKNRGEVTQNKEDNPIILIDFHAEATSEKLCFAWYVRERVSAVIGTHTHVPTADARILDNKVAYVTDVGMCGPHEASLWVDFENVINNFRFPTNKSFKMKKGGKKEFHSVLITFQKSLPNSIERVDSIIK